MRLRVQIIEKYCLIIVLYLYWYFYLFSMRRARYKLVTIFLTDISLYSLTRKYGEVFSLRLGAFKVVVAASGDSVKEMLVKRSGDYAGRPPFHTFELMMLGKSILATATNCCVSN